MLILKSEVEVDYARILKQIQQCALRLHVDCLLVPQYQALVDHFDGIVLL